MRFAVGLAFAIAALLITRYPGNQTWLLSLSNALSVGALVVSFFHVFSLRRPSKVTYITFTGLFLALLQFVGLLGIPSLKEISLNTRLSLHVFVVSLGLTDVNVGVLMGLSATD
jgi:hypothetical protein